MTLAMGLGYPARERGAQMLAAELPLPLLRKDMELVSRPSAGRISSMRTTLVVLNSVTAC